MDYRHPTQPADTPARLAPQTLPPTYRLTLPGPLLDALGDLSCRFVAALLKVAHQVVHQRRGFPTLAELGLAAPHIALLGAQLPAAPTDLLVIGRLDVVTNGTDYVAYELNGDQPGGLEYVSLVEDGLTLPADSSLAATSPYRCYLDAAIHHYQQRTGRSQPTGVLLLGNRYHLLTRLQEALTRFFSCPVLVSQQGEGCEFDGEHLLWRDPQGVARPVDLVLRSPRVNIYELCAEPFLPVRRAWESGAAVLVNPPHSRVAGCKALLPALRQEHLLDRADVTATEAEAVARLLPEVIRVTESQRALLQGQQERWVLKAPLGGKGDQVYIGPVTEPAVWEAVLDQALGAPGWTASAYHPPFDHQVTLDDSERTVRTPASTDPYVVVGEQMAVAGILSRAVIPTTDDPAELRSVKLNLLGKNTYLGSDGVERSRTVGLGRILRA
ncbi:MAG: hypothetical protein ABI333_06235 [bacterium]